MYTSKFMENTTEMVWGKERRVNLHTQKIHRVLTKFAVPNDMVGACDGVTAW